MRGGPLAGAAALALSAVTGPASAAPLDLRLEYRAAPGCPHESSFVDAVVGRTPSLRFRPGASRSLRVELKTDEGGARGSVALEGDEAGVREIGGASCDEVASALVLVVALALGGEGVGGEEARSRPSAPPTAPAPSDARRGPRASTGALVGVTTSLAPAARPVLGAFFELATGVTKAPSLRLSAFYAASGALAATTGEAHLRRATFALDALPLGWGAFEGRFDVFPFVGAEGGVLGVTSGDDRAGVVSVNRGWAAVRAGGRARVSSGSGLGAEIDAGLDAPLTRYILRDGAGQLLEKTPTLGFFGGAAASVRF